MRNLPFYLDVGRFSRVVRARERGGAGSEVAIKLVAASQLPGLALEVTLLRRLDEQLARQEAVVANLRGQEAECRSELGRAEAATIASLTRVIAARRELAAAAAAAEGGDR